MCVLSEYAQSNWPVAVVLSRGSFTTSYLYLHGEFIHRKNGWAARGDTITHSLGASSPRRNGFYWLSWWFRKKRFSLVFEGVGVTGRQRATYKLASVNNQSRELRKGVCLNVWDRLAWDSRRLACHHDHHDSISDHVSWCTPNDKP